MKRVRKYMRILIVCNVLIPEIAILEGKEGSVYGGWISGVIEGLRRESDMEIGICYPESEGGTKGYKNNLWYYSFSCSSWNQIKIRDDDDLVEEFKIIISDFEPDILHVFGTEYVHSYAAVKAFHNPDKTVVNIQGLVSVYARHYVNGIPEKILKGNTIGDFIFRRNIYKEQRVFQRKGITEKNIITNCNHVIGRTEWDRACTFFMNPDIQYHFCGETLRSTFYKNDVWNYMNCEKHSVFISQASYPVKGFHFALEAFSAVKKIYPDLKIYVAGQPRMRGNRNLPGSENPYDRYILNRTLELDLQDNIIYTNHLTAEQMKDYYLQCNVFVSPSLIENSPNSLCEAMILGCPVISSDVGGVKEFIEHGRDGYIYPCDEPYMLAYYILKIFDEQGNLSLDLNEAKRKIGSIMDREKNCKCLCDIYRQIYR